ncbi:Gfo/Idh/MocA family protein [Cognatiyoonia koreensis]|nr:Gfo/Idh/MocA family oxidoreductase [Cognatiyoonia koreensis]
MPTKIALVGIGEIARNQHDPSIRNSDAWELAATVSRSGSLKGVEAFTDMDAMLAARPDISVISLCLPPVPRFDYAKKAIAAGRHVMLEKPPGATLAEVHALQRLADDAGVVLFATWHSRMAKGVAAAKAFLSDKQIDNVHIDWQESVRKWHPGQTWIAQPGGMGVMDPGINALSIMTEVLPMAVHLTGATLRFPENWDTPIMADLTFTQDVTASFDWTREKDEQWEIHITAGSDQVTLIEGGNRCLINGEETSQTALDEYPALYARMSDLLANGTSDVDLSPMVHVSDAFTLGKRINIPAFDF